MKKKAIIFLRSFYGSSISEVKYSGKTRTFHYYFITIENGVATTKAITTSYLEMERALVAQIRRIEILSMTKQLGSISLPSLKS